MNVALYGPRAARWSMTERRRSQVTRDTTALAIGPSTMQWHGDALHITVDEICAPLPRRLRGTVKVMPTALNTQEFDLGGHGRHHWLPFGPHARLEMDFGEPRMQWSGVGYFDSNRGTEPLEEAFDAWTWSRAALPASTVVLYDYQARGARPESLALRFGHDARVAHIEPPPQVTLPRTGWRVARTTRADDARSVQVLATLEDAPFYSRSLLQTQLLGAPALAIHESLDLRRFSSRWVQCLLPFRMPRSPYSGR